MKYMLDTNICIYVIKNKPAVVRENFTSHDIEGVCISSITLAELMHGAEKSQYKEKTKKAIMSFLAPIKILDFDGEAAFEYGKIRASLEMNGKIIGPMDMLIAAHARSRSLVLVTNNTREFERVEDLILENWVD